MNINEKYLKLKKQYMGNGEASSEEIPDSELRHHHWVNRGKQYGCHKIGVTERQHRFLHGQLKDLTCAEMCDLENRIIGHT